MLGMIAVRRMEPIEIEQTTSCLPRQKLAIVATFPTISTSLHSNSTPGLVYGVQVNVMLRRPYLVVRHPEPAPSITLVSEKARTRQAPA